MGRLDRRVRGRRIRRRDLVDLGVLGANKSLESRTDTYCCYFKGIRATCIICNT